MGFRVGLNVGSGIYGTWAISLSDRQWKVELDRRQSLKSSNSMSSQCQGRTVKGSQCTRRCPDSGAYCWQHIQSQRLIPVHNYRPIESRQTVANCTPPNPIGFQGLRGVEALPRGTRELQGNSSGTPTLSVVDRPRLRLRVSRPTNSTNQGEVGTGTPSVRETSHGVGNISGNAGKPLNLQRTSLESANAYAREAYLRMSVQDRFQIPMSSVTRMLKIYGLGYRDHIMALTVRDQLIATRRLRSRLDAFFHRPAGPYLDLSGNRYYNENYSRSIAKPLHYGEFYYHPYNGSCRILGERDLNLERQSYDPVFPKVVCQKLEVQVSDTKEYINHKERVLDSYKMDLVTFCELSEFDDPDMIYLDVSGRAYYLHSILGRWEAGFSIYDKECGRIVPQYPLDFNNEPMHPQLVRNIYGTYKHRILSQGLLSKAPGVPEDQLRLQEPRNTTKIRGFGYPATESSTPTEGSPGSWNPKEYPLLEVLCCHNNLLEDLYQFIVGYKEIRRKYDSVTELYPEDEGLANRRDLIAIQALKQLYERQRLENYGYRKYASYTSTNGANGTQVFYQYVLCSLFMTTGYRPAIDTQDDDGLPVNLRWEYLPDQVSAVIVGSSILPICRHGYHYLLAFK